MAATPQGQAFLACCIFLVLIAILSLRYPYSAAFELPLYFSVLALLEAGWFLRVWSRRRGIRNPSSSPTLRSRSRSRSRSREWDQKSLPVLADHVSRRSPSPSQRLRWHFRSCIARTPSRTAWLIIAVVMRCSMYWAISRVLPCTAVPFESLLPFFVVLHLDKTSSSSSSQLGHATTTTTTAASSGLRPWLVRLQNIFIVVCWVWSSYGAVRWSSTHTGAICSSKLSYAQSHASHAKFAVLIFDSILLYNFARMRQDQDDAARPPCPRIASILLTSGGALSVLATLPFVVTNSLRWLIWLDHVAIRDLILDSFLAAGALVLGIYLLAFIHPSTLVQLASSTSIFASLVAPTVKGAPDTDGLPFLRNLVTALVTGGLLLRLEKFPAFSTKVRATDNRLWRLLVGTYTAFAAMLGMFFVICYMNPLASGGLISLPELVTAARIRSQEWVTAANQSNSLSEAVDEYLHRYDMPPPPEFDKWFEFARSRNSVIIDDFDQINSDLRPFWGVQPKDLRQQTAHLLEYTSLGNGGITIQNGKVDFLPGIPGSHIWLLTSLQKMIEPFAEHLPDMVFAINLNDEPRVSIPYDVMRELKNEATEAQSRLSQQNELHRFSPPSAEESRWLNMTLLCQESKSPYFQNLIRHPLYYDLVAPSCPPDTAARQWRWWNRRDLCLDCLKPHSRPIIEGGRRVVLDWSAAMDLCHQPDLAYLHGWLLSPAAAVPTNMVFPVFSQSRTSGFADILIPSPWNYNDKSPYDEGSDPAWADKQDTLFWRGSASDGYAAHGSWQTFLRARLVGLASRFRWDRFIDETWLRPESLDFDIKFVGQFDKCHQKDCRAEEDVFWGPGQTEPQAKPVPFEQHWQYKHLMDVDGAGFSGRFIPFLQSKSLVYRTGLFQTWFGDRVHAWRHFIPVDVRLHELGNLLWFFGRGEKGEALAEEIAAEGAEWAAKVLRKEDMEVYMFRLLLEWGRLVDDQRESLGFVL